MALLVNNYTTIYGVQAAHWVVDSININEKYRYAEITIFGYYSGEVYISGASPLETKKVKVNWNDGFDDTYSKRVLSITKQNIYSIAYGYIKANMEMFKNAIDV